MAARSLASQAQIGAHGGRGAGAHARAPPAVNHGSKEPERRENDDDGNGSSEQSTMDTVVRPKHSLEELVDRLMDALFRDETEAAVPAATGNAERGPERPRGAPDAAGEGPRRRAGGPRRNGHGEGGDEAGSVGFAEWKQLVKRRFGGRDVLVYSQDTGRGAALVPNDDGTLEVVAVLGMRWRPGKVVSGRSLRGLRPLSGVRDGRGQRGHPRAESTSPPGRHGGGIRRAAQR